MNGNSVQPDRCFPGAAAPEGACDYCGLPLSSPLLPWPRRAAHDVRAAQWSGNAGGASSEPRYCCFGCRFAASVAQEKGDQGQVNWMLARLGLCIFLSLNVMVFTMALWSDDVYAAKPLSGTAQASALADVFRYLCLLASLPVLLLLGAPMVDNAWRNVRAGVPNTDLLLVLGVAAAYVYSAISVFRGQGHIYFEVGCSVLVMVTLGRWLEATGRLKTSAALDALEKLLPERVRRLADGREQLIPLEQVAPGDVLRVVAGERFAVDGRVLSGSAAVDEQLLTGESRPAVKEPGDAVLSGTLNLDGDLRVEVVAPASAGSLRRLIDAVHAARRSKGRYQRLADRIACWFVPLVIAVALAAAAWHGTRHGVDEGLLAGLAVVLIACPCALGLATPLAVWAAFGQAAGHQVLLRSGEALERLAGVQAVCFDKTGTLTSGHARVVAMHHDEAAQRSVVRRRAAGLASASRHPLAAAVADYGAGEEFGLEAEPMWTSVRSLAGRGLEGRLPADDGRTVETVYLGSMRLMEEAGLVVPEALAAAMDDALGKSHSLCCIGWAGRVRGVYSFSEETRPEAEPALEHCRALGLHLTILTGDVAARGAALAARLGLRVHAQLLPEEKVAALGELRALVGPTAMVGDGINDAPSLAAADVGIALGCGADLSRQSADICLLGDDLRRVPWTMDLARRCVAVIRQNLFWAFAYNVVGIGLACAGLLNPIWAAAAMLASSLLVISNSLRLGGPAADCPDGTAGDWPLTGKAVGADSSLTGDHGRAQNCPSGTAEQWAV